MFEKKAIQYAPFKDGAGHPFPVEDIMLPYKDTYNGNILIKKAFVKSELSMNHIIEAARCEKDPIYFIENYCRIVSLDDGIIPFKLFDYQKKMIKMYAENRFSLTLTARQMGKTAAMAAFILWFAIFHPTKTIAVLANKGEQAQEIMDLSSYSTALRYTTSVVSSSTMARSFSQQQLLLLVFVDVLLTFVILTKQRSSKTT
jgi:hypothetical protein